MISQVFVAATAASVAGAASSPEPLVPFVYEEIPLGSITPNGWLRSEMETEAAGLAGHLYDFYSFVHNSSWLGGDYEYSGLNEAFPYWMNGIIPLAYALDDQRLKDQVHDAVDYLLDNMVKSDGWIGPEEGGYRLLWARTLVFFAWTNLVDANSTYEEPIVNAMHDFNGLMNQMLKNNGTGLRMQEDSVLDEGYYFWFMSRVAEMIVSLQWLYDKHPRGNEQIIMENMQMLHGYGHKWEAWFTQPSYAFKDLYDLPENITNDNFQFLHGVNVGEGKSLVPNRSRIMPADPPSGLKAPAVVRRFTHNDSLIQTSKEGVQWTFKYHGAASGTVLADEREDGVNPYYGAETCTAVEVMFSQSYLYRALGDGMYADGSELAAFNALPGAMTGDWWAHVYMSQPNQPYSKNLSETPFYNTDSVGQTFGLEPNYPCCTVNHPQGYPKFAQAAYVKIGDNGLVHALLTPATVRTTVNARSAMVECQTNYPFEDTLHYNVQAEAPFDFYVRQPTWADDATISSSAGSSTYDAETGLHKISLPAGASTMTYHINTPLRIEHRANDTVSIHRGALLYAAEIGADVSSTGPHNYTSQELYPADYAPPESRDYTMLNTTEWKIAIDPSTLVYHPANNEGSVGALPTPIFASGSPQMYITVKACLIDWPLFKGSVPGNVIPKSERECRSDVFEAKMVPYGSAKVRMTDLPTIDLT